MHVSVKDYAFEDFLLTIFYLKNVTENLYIYIYIYTYISLKSFNFPYVNSMDKTGHNFAMIYTMIKEQGRWLIGANHCVFSPIFYTGCPRFSTVLQPALSYIIKFHL